MQILKTIMRDITIVQSGLYAESANFIAFHTQDYTRHAISAVERVLHIDFKLDEIRRRVTVLDYMPCYRSEDNTRH